jgi:serine O-acetyltransferase
MRLNKRLQRLYWKVFGLNHVEDNVPLSTLFPHPIGIVIGGRVRMGEKCRISQGVTIGRKSLEFPAQPVIGNNVRIYSNAILIGNISIGDNSVIGAGSVVLKSFPANSVIVGNPARRLK